MKRQPIYMIALNENQADKDIAEYLSFIKNVQTAVLLSLLEKGQLTKRQFDLCIEKVNHMAI